MKYGLFLLSCEPAREIGEGGRAAGGGRKLPLLPVVSLIFAQISQIAIVGYVFARDNHAIARLFLGRLLFIFDCIVPGDPLLIYS